MLEGGSSRFSCPKCRLAFESVLSHKRCDARADDSADFDETDWKSGEARMPPRLIDRYGVLWIWMLPVRSVPPAGVIVPVMKNLSLVPGSPLSLA